MAPWAAVPEPLGYPDLPSLKPGLKRLLDRLTGGPED